MTDLAPTLGPQVAHFINKFGVHGPGDLMGEQFALSFEELAFLYRVYEIQPNAFKPGRWHRRYRHGIYCRRKGMRKSELMAQVTLAEFDGPVRFSGEWSKGGEVDEWGYEFGPGEPMGERVLAPEIPVVATTEEQAERLVWGVIRYVFSHSPLASRYKVQQDQIFFAGKTKEEGWAFIVPPNNSDAADGAKPSFIPREEAHLWTSKNLRDTAKVMDRNAIKREKADPWTMDATTAYAPGENSVLESSVKAAKGDDSILYDYLAANKKWDLDNKDEWLEAVKEASGDAWPWTNVARMRSLFISPEVSRPEFARYQLNQHSALAAKPFDGDSFDLFENKSRTPGPSKASPIVLFLDGSLTRDATALVGWTVEDRPHMFLAGLWAKPPNRREWTVPKREVNDRIDDLVDTYHVVTLAADSDRYWSPEIRAWEEEWGDEMVVHFATRHGKLMTTAIDRWEEDWRVGLIKASQGSPMPWTHDGSPELRSHFASVVLAPRGRNKVLEKATESMDDKIDAAVAGISGYSLIADARTKVIVKEGVKPWAG